MHKPGTVVWAKMGAWPPWPAVIVSRTFFEENVTVELLESFPKSTSTNACIKFFNWCECWDVLDHSDLEPFAENIMYISNGNEDVKKAVQEAIEFLDVFQGDAKEQVFSDEEFRIIATEFGCIVPEIESRHKFIRDNSDDLFFKGAKSTPRTRTRKRPRREISPDVALMAEKGGK